MNAALLNAERSPRIYSWGVCHSHLTTYLGVNVMLVVINLVTSPGNLWFFWVSIFWGCGLLIHGLNVFGPLKTLFGKDWEDRKIQELMDEKEKRTLDEDYFEEELQ